MPRLFSRGISGDHLQCWAEEVFISFFLWYLLILWHKNLFLFSLECIFNGDDVLRHVFMSRLRLTGSQTCSFRNRRFIRRKIKTKFLRRCVCVWGIWQVFLMDFGEFFQFILSLFLWEVFWGVLTLKYPSELMMKCRKMKFWDWDLLNFSFDF